MILSMFSPSNWNQICRNLFPISFGIAGVVWSLETLLRTPPTGSDMPLSLERWMMSGHDWWLHISVVLKHLLTPQPSTHISLWWLCLQKIICVWVDRCTAAYLPDISAVLTDAAAYQCAFARGRKCLAHWTRQKPLIAWWIRKEIPPGLRQRISSLSLLCQVVALWLRTQAKYVHFGQAELTDIKTQRRTRAVKPGSNSNLLRWWSIMSVIIFWLMWWFFPPPRQLPCDFLTFLLCMRNIISTGTKINDKRAF